MLKFGRARFTSLFLCYRSYLDMAQLRYHFSEILLNLLSNQLQTIYICPLKYVQVALREHHNPWEFLLTKCLVHLWSLARISAPFPPLCPGQPLPEGHSTKHCRAGDTQVKKWWEGTAKALTAQEGFAKVKSLSTPAPPENFYPV